MTNDEDITTLLLVDDEPAILAALRRLFRRAGYRLLTAEGGAAGLALLEREAVDLVISDMRMPQMDGTRFLEQVRDRWPDVVRVLLTGYADMASTVSAINRGEIYRYIAKPWNDEDLLLTVREGLERRRLARENRRLLDLSQRQNGALQALNATLEETVARRTAELARALADATGAHGALKRGFLESVRVFAGLIELRAGKRLGGHSRRVADAARAVARRLGAEDAEVQDIMLAGLLHDIGKIGLPDELLDRPFNTLAPEARAAAMRHPVVGEQLLMGVEALRRVATIVRHHHECFDGSGYPDGLAGLAIPLGSRVLAVAGDFDACQIGTLVQRPLAAAEALAFVTANAGRRYDPEVVQAFAAWFADAHRDGPIELPLRPDRLQAGQVLARDLMNHDGHLLLARGQAVDGAIIGQLRRLEEIEGRALTVLVRGEGRTAP